MARWDAGWMRRFNQILVDLSFRTAEEAAVIRKKLAEDPVAFALLYMRHHLRGRETGDTITFSEAHFHWARMAETWKVPPAEPQGGRQAVIAPRGTGKSTWWFLILPLWAAANGHIRFAAAFANAAAQAEGHLSTMKAELDTNPLLRHDYPRLCKPRRNLRGATVADRQGMIQQSSGFTFAGRGIDSAVLGLKVGDQRPDLLILDDIEPDEASYSPDQAVKRLGTVVDAIFELNVYAPVVMVGTVTMPGSIMHQLVKHASDIETAEWIADQKLSAYHHRAIVDDEKGRRSLWEEKWPLEWLDSISHTRSYAKNYDNDPMARDGVYWVREDFQYGPIENVARTALFIDPIVSENRTTSDLTGLAVVGWAPPRSGASRSVPGGDPGRCLVLHAEGVRKTGAHLRGHVLSLLARFPAVRAVIIEVNQGADLWHEILHDLPVKVITGWHGASKDLRFTEGVDHYQQRRVWHIKRLPAAEEQMVAYPNGAYDDVADAVNTGVLYFLGGQRKIVVRERVTSYA